MVIDVLRASTTIATAIAGGAAGLVPVRDLAAARDRAAALGAGVLTGGERGGRRIDGFDLGNSPLEYAPDRVAGRTIVFTTTNGTAAIDACAAAREILVGAIVNRTAVATACRALSRLHGGAPVHLVCAGTDGEVALEDLLGAGAILDAAATGGQAADELDPPAREALERFRRVATVAGRIAPEAAGELGRAFRTAPGGSNLVALGMDDDLVAASRIDALAAVPRLDRGRGMLVGFPAAG